MAKSVETLIAEIGKALKPTPESFPEEARIVRRKGRSLVRSSGRSRVTDDFVRQLATALEAAAICTSPPLTARPLFQDDWVYFSNMPIRPDSVFFAREQDLCDFIRRGLGVLPLLMGLREIENEFRLGTRQRIDLLCEELAQSRRGDLVAIELKRGDPGYGVKAQLDAYLDALKQHPKAKGRQVRGIIISGPDEDAQSAAKAPSKNRIAWFYYKIGLEKAISRSSEEGSENGES
jgi:hypothetical protein